MFRQAMKGWCPGAERNPPAASSTYSIAGHPCKPSDACTFPEKRPTEEPPDPGNRTTARGGNRGGGSKGIEISLQDKKYPNRQKFTTKNRRISWQLRLACWYAQGLGFAVFPAQPWDKKPYYDRELIRYGLKSASRDCELIEAWWRRWPNALIGARTGADAGCIVCDIDRKDGRDGAAELAKRGYRLDETWIARSRSGGLHAYYRHPGWEVRNAGGGKRWPLPGVEVRGDDGCITLPGARDGYRWTKWRPGRMDQPAPMPGWLDRVLRERDQPPPRIIVPTSVQVSSAYARAALEGIAAEIREAMPGSRQGTLSAKAYRAGALVREGRLPHHEAQIAVLAAAQSMRADPTANGAWDPRAAIDTARRCFDAGVRHV